VAWIKQNIHHNNRLPQILRSVELPLPSSLLPLIDMGLHEEFCHDHPLITQQSKQEMMIILIDTIETKLHESQILFNAELRKIWQD